MRELKDLLIKLIEEGESFNSKRPFGDSDWEYELGSILVEQGKVKGGYDYDPIKVKRELIKIINKWK